MNNLSRIPARKTVSAAVLKRVVLRLVGWVHLVILLATGRAWRRPPFLALVPLRVRRPS